MLEVYLELVGDDLSIQFFVWILAQIFFSLRSWYKALTVWLKLGIDIWK